MVIDTWHRYSYMFSMLRLFTLFIISILISTTSFALFSHLELTMYDGGQFTVVIDNQQYNTPSNKFFISNLLPGNHLIQINRTVSFGGPYNNYGNPYFYSGLISIPYNVSIKAFVDSFRSFNVINISPLGYLTNPLENNISTIGTHPNIFDRKFNLQDSISNKEFTDYIQSQGSSKVRLLAMKRSIIPNKITANQVSELMKLLDFDIERLEFARFAYYFTVDRHNYYKVKTSFIFSSTATELSNHLFDYN